MIIGIPHRIKHVLKVRSYRHADVVNNLILLYKDRQAFPHIALLTGVHEGESLGKLISMVDAASRRYAVPLR